MPNARAYFRLMLRLVAGPIKQDLHCRFARLHRASGVSRMQFSTAVANPTGRKPNQAKMLR
ncbi:MAG TPA: hypothetical protein DD423_08500 [Opitutae bacterium]|nr:hypothetical protein [Opitutae bacterium]